MIYLRARMISSMGLCFMPLSLLSLAGCAYLGLPPMSDLPTASAKNGPEPAGNPAVARTMLAAARSNRINLFGESAWGGSAEFHGRAAVSLRQHTFASEGADQGVDVDPAGGRIVFSSTRHNLNPDLYVKSVEGVAVTQLTSDPASDVQPQFSPDGTRVAFASDRGGNWDIWIIQVTGGAPVQVTSSPADEISPSWSPEGDRLVYCSRSSISGQWELWLTDATAGAEKKFIGHGLFPEWSPVDETIVYQRARERGSRHFSIWTLQLVDGEPRYPTEIASSGSMALIQPAFSPDGSRVAYTAVSSFAGAGGGGFGGDMAADVWVVDADGYGKMRLTDGHSANFDPAFAADGRVFFSTRRGSVEHLWSLLPPDSMMGAGGETGIARRDAGRDARATAGRDARATAGGDARAAGGGSGVPARSAGETRAATIIEPGGDDPGN